MKRTLAALALVAGPCASAAQAAQSYECPRQVAVDEASLKLPAETAAVWQGRVSNGPVPLTGALLYDGPASGRAALKPTSESRGGRRATWVIEGGRHPDGTFLVCDYAQGLVTLETRLDASTTRCTLDYLQAKRPPGLRVRATCR